MLPLCRWDEFRAMMDEKEPRMLRWDLRMSKSQSLVAVVASA